MNKYFYVDWNIIYVDKVFKFGMMINGFSDYFCWVSEVNYLCIWIKFFDIFYDVKNYWNGM